MSVSLAVLLALFAVLAVMLVRRGRGAAEDALERALEQVAVVVPQLAVALLAAGFLAKLIPSELIGRWMGPDAGWAALIVGALAGPVIPAGPVLAFSIAAVLERAGATPEALVAFVTSWSLFTLHRVLTYELPLLGASFLKLRLASVGLMPVAAGLIAAAIVRMAG